MSTIRSPAAPIPRRAGESPGHPPADLSPFPRAGAAAGAASA
ncbi:hypothetical protein SCATT_p15610 (plasmid) [Streptantibioticus cattleyicolor NRRL 8057 = DSM 46488]|uniref:Uncharacterized protein n=1 Tax=Streptantibioticus cattleyicolor (strain ATCC 35852 / DSM 46488 / JCM 4925 / NBRC 14057 / NRRL 8057) TaxID=1003195 RepID=G8XH36_STREN|nr:hypothetical protein SCATT_p15610 [Streptantibioticus cattleyicolor NRRL 8057 = DSM 46488]